MLGVVKLHGFGASGRASAACPPLPAASGAPPPPVEPELEPAVAGVPVAVASSPSDPQVAPTMALAPRTSITRPRSFTGLPSRTSRRMEPGDCSTEGRPPCATPDDTAGPRSRQSPSATPEDTAQRLHRKRRCCHRPRSEARGARSRRAGGDEQERAVLVELKPELLVRTGPRTPSPLPPPRQGIEADQARVQAVSIIELVKDPQSPIRKLNVAASGLPSSTSGRSEVAERTRRPAPASKLQTDRVRSRNPLRRFQRRREITQSKRLRTRSPISAGGMLGT